MPEQTKLEFVGDSASLEGAIKRLQAENAKLKAGFDDTAKASVKGSKETQQALTELDRIAARVRESTKTAAEKEAEALTKLRVAHTMGKITAEEYARAQKQIASESEKVVARTREIETNTSSLASTVVSGIGSMVAGYLSLDAAIKLVNDEFDGMIERQKQALSRNVTAGNATESLAINMGGDVTPEQFRNLVTGLNQTVQGTRMTSPDALLSGASGAVSSLGESDPIKRAQRVLAAARAIAPLASDTTAEGLFTMVAQSGQVTGAQTEADFRRVLALGAGAQGMSSVTGFDAMRFASRAGALSLTNQAAGADKERGYQDALAIWAAVTNATKDTTGEASSTAVAGMSGKLRTFFAENNIQGAGTFMERLQYLQRNQGMASSFADTLGDGADAGLWRKALDPKSEFAQAIAANVAGIKPDEAALDNIAANLRATPQQGFAASQAAIEANRNALKQGRVGDARIAQVRDVLFGENGFGETEDFATRAIMRARFETAVGMGYDPIEQGRAEIEALQRPNRNEGRLGMLSSVRSPAAKAREAEVFESMLKSLKAIEDATVNGRNLPQSDAARGQIGVHRE